MTQREVAPKLKCTRGRTFTARFLLTRAIIPAMNTFSLQGLRNRLFGHRDPAASAEQAQFGGEDKEPQVVYTAANAMEADLVVALLGSEGIQAFTSGEALGAVYGLQVGPLAEVQVLTAASLAERAREIISEHYLEDEEEADDGVADDAEAL